jgi:hypothetical protein
MYAAGIPARILKCGSHRYVEYNDGTGWKQFPGYTDTGRKWGGKHHGSASCHTTPTIIVPPGTSPENRPGLDHR